MTAIKAIKTYFEKDGGRKVDMNEMKALSPMKIDRNWESWLVMQWERLSKRIPSSRGSLTNLSGIVLQIRVQVSTERIEI